MIFRRPDYFIAIVETGSLTKASEQLYISQPSLSQYLKRLEDYLGVELFDRSSFPLHLTYVGERYYQSVKQYMALRKITQKEIQDMKSQTSGKIRLGVALWRGSCILPDVFPALYQKYPGIHIELTEGRSIQLENGLMNGTIDLAVMNLPKTLDYAKLICDIILEERIFLAAPTNHPYVQVLLAKQPEKSALPVASLREFLEHVPLVLTKPGQNLTHEIRYALNKKRIEPNVLLETENLTTAINLVSTGIVCTFVPEEGSRVCERPGKVTYFLTDIPELVWPLAVVYRKDTYLTNICRLFIESLMECIGRKQ